MCRARNDGVLPHDYLDRPFDLWLHAALVAILQLIGGIGNLPAGAPTNTAEYAHVIPWLT